MKLNKLVPAIIPLSLVFLSIACLSQKSIKVENHFKMDVTVIIVFNEKLTQSREEYFVKAKASAYLDVPQELFN